MKLILLVLIGFSCRNINARLIEKITDRTLTTETKTTGSSPPVRLTRDTFDEDSGIGSSKEEGSNEQVRIAQGFNKKTSNFSASKPRKVEPSSLVRVIRDSHEKADKSKKNTTASQHAPTKQKVLVKKPIPKYNNEMDYDEDFQMKMNKSPMKVVDSGEHEDEDFNVDDYEFDVNHDEFIGRGKPLEPRLKNKVNQDRSNQPTSKNVPKSAHHPEIKTHSKAHQAAASHRPISNKRAAQYPASKKAGEKEDYYDDTTTAVSVTEKEKTIRDSDDEFGDDNEETKEDEGPKAAQSVRTIRSPWKINSYVDKFGAKSSSVMSKVLTILPMFPEVPKNNEEQIVGPSVNPWYSRRS